ncbi:rRNA pseudouridine synthase [Candidatus Parcubacteria bacterium]|nr:rRNA pseudouridine synthase [Candidatus Parcubacteria bacterium]
MKIVLQKFIANSGYCSRRKAEELIKDGKVFVNNKKPKLGDRVSSTGSEQVTVDGRKIETQEEKIYIMLNKPIGYVCTTRKFKGEENIFDLISIKMQSIMSLHIVGRLDKNSHGLVLLTNDGELTQKLTHPKYEHEKEYEILVKSKKSKVESFEIIKLFEEGVDIGDDDGIVKVKDIKYLDDNKFSIILTEGKKRQIRRMFKVVDCDVINLTRTRIGKLKLGDLKKGEWRSINKKDII